MLCVIPAQAGIQGALGGTGRKQRDAVYAVFARRGNDGLFSVRWIPARRGNDGLDARAGVREYWLVDARGDRLKFDVFHFTADGYVAAEPAYGWLSSRVFHREFRLERTRDRIGRWRYRLHVREVPK